MCYHGKCSRSQYIVLCMLFAITIAAIDRAYGAGAEKKFSADSRFVSGAWIASRGMWGDDNKKLPACELSTISIAGKQLFFLKLKGELPTETFFNDVVNPEASGRRAIIDIEIDNVEIVKIQGLSTSTSLYLEWPDNPNLFEQMLVGAKMLFRSGDFREEITLDSFEAARNEYGKCLFGLIK
jgi:hypothetical protein